MRWLLRRSRSAGDGKAARLALKNDFLARCGAAGLGLRAPESFVLLYRAQRPPEWRTVRSFTGLILHEWLGLAMVGMVFAHLLLAWSWIASQTRRLFSSQSIRARVNYLLNLSLFASVTAVIFSGILISQKAIPALTGAQAAHYMDWRWDTLHNQFSQTVVILSGFHLAINWDWALAAGEKIFRRVRDGAL